MATNSPKSVKVGRVGVVSRKVAGPVQVPYAHVLHGPMVEPPVAMKWPAGGSVHTRSSMTSGLQTHFQALGQIRVRVSPSELLGAQLWGRVSAVASGQSLYWILPPSVLSGSLGPQKVQQLFLPPSP